MSEKSELIEEAYNLGQQAAENWEEESLRESEYYQEKVLRKFRMKAGYLDLDDIEMKFSCPPNGESIYLLKDMKSAFWDGFEKNSN